MNAFANIIVDELRKYAPYIPTEIFRKVAQEAATMYPNSLLEVDREESFISNYPRGLIFKND